MKGHLSDIGYEQKQHDDLIQAVKDRRLPISDTIEAVAEVYETLYNQDPYEINCGNCEEFAADVIDALGMVEGDTITALWHDEMPDCTAQENVWWSHKFIRFQGRYYDSECPEGVDEWRELPCFQNNPV